MKRICRCDLHTHSIFSDGTCTPTHIIDMAINEGLSSIALCDHNTVDGLPEFLACAKGKNIKAVPGCEFSVDLNGKEIHLLGLFIEPSCFTKVSDFMNEVIFRKEQSNIQLINSLNRAGYKLDYEKIKSNSPKGKINRAHIATELTKLGYTQSIEQAFRTLLSSKAGYYKEPKRISVWEMIDFISSIHAAPILAHPFLNLTKEELLEFLPKAKKQGLIGMETEYSLFDTETTILASSIAESFGIKQSGGSDFHGSTKPDIQLGIGKGDLCVPNEWCNEIEYVISRNNI